MNISLLRNLTSGRSSDFESEDRSQFIDPILFFLLFAVSFFGFLVLHGAANGDEVIIVGHVVRSLVAFGALLLVSQIQPRLWVNWVPVLYVGSLILLVAVMAFGITARGSQRWLDLPGLPRFQPSELLKITVPLMLAWYLQNRAYPLRFIDFIVAVLIFLVPASLILLQPDFGTSLLLVMGCCGVLFLAGMKWRWIIAIGASAVAALPLIWNFVLYPYHKRRILTLFNPEQDLQGDGWQIIQSKTAIGSGGMYGKGMGQGTQSRLDFLPDSQTDFILAVVAEEWGFVWTTSLLVVYVLIFARGLQLAVKAKTSFSRLAISGLLMIFAMYVIVNVAMVLGLLPVVGAPLPLMSYGGSSVFTLLVGLGIVLALHKESERAVH